MDALYQDLLDEGIENVRIIAIGKGQYSSDNPNWINGNSIPIVVDPSPNHTWNNWDANQRDLFFLNSNISHITHFNITSWDYAIIYNTIVALLSACTGQLGDMNIDGIWNIQDIIIQIDCVLNDNCGDIENGCAGDINGDATWSVLDIVLLINCVLNDNCE